MIKKITPLAAVAVTFLLPLVGHAQATIGTDNAGNYSGNYAGQNMGTGFGAFSVTAVNNQPPYSGTFIGSAAGSEGGNGIPAPSTIDTGGQSFGFYANGGSTATVTITRPFSTALSNTNDVFSLSFVPGYNDAGSSGAGLTSGTDTIGVFRFVAGGDGKSNGTGFTFNGTSIGQGFTDGAINLTYTVTAPGQYSLATTGAVTFNGTGTFTNPLDGAKITMVNSGSGAADHNGYFNNLSITNNIAPTPELGGMVSLLLGIAFLGGIIVVRRRRGVTA